MPSNNPIDPWLPGTTVPLTRDAVPITVYRITGSSTLEEMDSLRCVSITWREGPVPRSATFRYAFDGLDTTSPQDFEQALSTAFTGAKVVNPGDRLAVQATMPDGTYQWIFDGHAYTFGGQLGHGEEVATVNCLGVEHRLWDKPIGGAFIRNANAPETVSDFSSDLVIQFNPKGRPNACPSTADAGTSPYTFPSQMDPNKTGEDAAMVAYPRYFDLPMAVGHLLYRFNSAMTWVKNPTRATLNSVLVAREPISGTAYDPTDPSTYTAKPIEASDIPLTDRALPASVHDLTASYGFGLRFPITDSSGLPSTAIEPFCKATQTPKPLYLQARTSTLDPAYSNVGMADLTRDLTPVVNQWQVRGGLLRWEASFVLAPIFASTATDGNSAASIQQWDSDEIDPTATNGEKYRVWVLDEGGDIHYLNLSTTAVTETATSLDAVLGASNYSTKRRIPIGTLLTGDANGRPLQARLAISTNYAGTYPKVWDGTGTWQNIEGGWKLLSDRIGIQITGKSPNDWKIGASQATGCPYPGGAVRAVEAMTGNGGQVPFFLRLTCVIEGDQALNAVASIAATSALSWPVEREIDARDRIQKWQVAPKSEFNTGTTAVTIRDDTNFATAEAISSRTYTDNGVFEGTVLIPRFTALYGVGDRINQITGRGLVLRTDQGGTEYAPVYPTVVSVHWDLDGGQRTTLMLSDEGMDREQKSVAKPVTKEANALTKEAKEKKYKQIAELAKQIQAAGFGVAINSDLSKHGRR